MNYFQKNKKNIIIGAISALLIATLIALWFQSNQVNNASEISALVTPKRMTLGDTLRYEDRTPNAKSIEWNFGDGKTSDKAKGYHVFTKEGSYDIKITIDNKFSKTFYVDVKPPEEVEVIEEPIRIIAPREAKQLDKVLFTAYPENAKLYEWSFGESGIVDTNEKNPSYTYKTSGLNTVKLVVVTDKGRQETSHSINILSSYVPEEQTVEDVSDNAKKSIDIATNDIKKYLQQIAFNNSFNSNYNYILSSYLCGNDNVAVIVNGDKKMTFYSYCMDLIYTKGFIIQEVKTTYDNVNKCIIKLEVTQTK